MTMYNWEVPVSCCYSCVLIFVLTEIKILRNILNFRYLPIKQACLFSKLPYGISSVKEVFTGWIIPVSLLCSICIIDIDVPLYLYLTYI